jgi:hypothetical protein
MASCQRQTIVSVSDRKPVLQHVSGVSNRLFCVIRGLLLNLSWLRHAWTMSSTLCAMWDDRKSQFSDGLMDPCSLCHDARQKKRACR